MAHLLLLLGPALLPSWGRAASDPFARFRENRMQEVMEALGLGHLGFPGVCVWEGGHWEGLREMAN